MAHRRRTPDGLENVMGSGELTQTLEAMTFVNAGPKRRT